MKIIEAVEHEGSVRIDVHLDESKRVRDPEREAPPEGEEDTRPMVADPGYIMALQWGADVPVATIKRETALLCAAELDRRSLPKVVRALDGVTLK